MKISTRFRFILYGLLLLLLISCPLTAPASLSALLSPEPQNPPYSQGTPETEAWKADPGEDASPAPTFPSYPTPTATIIAEAAGPAAAGKPDDRNETIPVDGSEETQQALIEVWEPPLNVFTLLSGICEGALKTAQQSASISSAKPGDGEKLAIDLFISAVEYELSRWRSTAETESHYSSARQHVDQLIMDMDRWEQGEVDAAEASEIIGESCVAIQDELEHVIRDAIMDGISKDSLNSITAELQKRLANQGVAANRPGNNESEIGLSRQKPFPTRGVHRTPRWSIEILETMRGEEAWQSLRAASSYNKPPRVGMEYVLVEIRAIRSYETDENRTISTWDFKLTGDRLREYPAAVVVEPEPALHAELQPGEETAGWVAFEITEDEDNLILILDEVANLGRKRFRYFSLTEGASIRPASNLNDIRPSSAGLRQREPVPVGKSAFTENWEIRVQAVVRGDVARQVLEANQETALPSDVDVEWVLAKVFVRYLGDTDTPATMDRFSFSSTGERNVLYEAPPVTAPHPALDITLFPGGEYEGWLVLQAEPGEQDLVVVFQPWNDLSSKNRRYLSLTP